MQIKKFNETKTIMAQAASKGSWALQAHIHPATGETWTPFDQLMAALVRMQDEGYVIVQMEQLEALNVLSDIMLQGEIGTTRFSGKNPLA